MTKTACFRIRGDFALFQWSVTRGDYRPSNLVISKTEVLGILGAIIGLDGYTQERMKKEEGMQSTLFSEHLRGLQVAIIPESPIEFFSDQLVHRAMPHVNKKRRTLQVNMKGLVQPAYLIYLRPGDADPSFYDKICEYLKNGWSEFIPYLGKNQFPAVVEWLGEQTVELVEEKEDLIVRSLVPKTEVKEFDYDYVEKENGEYAYIESIRVFRSAHAVGEVPVLWTNTEISLNESADVYKLDEENEHVVYL